MREHLETINHRDAILFVEELIEADDQLSEWNIKSLHALVLKEIDNENAGKYRIENVLIGGIEHIPPKHYELNLLMMKLLEDYSRQWKQYHPVVRAVLLHGEFVKMHPFIDGNSRTARLLLNYELMRNGYTPIIIKNTQRAEYYDVLGLAHTTTDYQPFIKLVSELVVESEKLWLNVIE